jgi:hypothetical protein
VRARVPDGCGYPCALLVNDWLDGSDKHPYDISAKQTNTTRRVP